MTFDLKLYFLFCIFLLSCGQDSLVSCQTATSKSKCVEQTDDEKAMIALNDNQLTQAQALFETLILQDPSSYFRYPRLAAVYAKQAGFDILSAASASSGGGDFLDQISSFLPVPDLFAKDVYGEFIKKMTAAKQTLEKMPFEERQQGFKFYGTSASFQLTLYSSALSIMILNQFRPKGTPEADAAKIASMTVEDAVQIISSLKDAAINSQTSDPEAAEKINSFLQKLDEQPGSSEQEKLKSYLEAQKK